MVSSSFTNGAIPGACEYFPRSSFVRTSRMTSSSSSVQLAETIALIFPRICSYSAFTLARFRGACTSWGISIPAVVAATIFATRHKLRAIRISPSSSIPFADLKPVTSSSIFAANGASNSSVPADVKGCIPVAACSRSAVHARLSFSTVRFAFIGCDDKSAQSMNAFA